MSIPPKWLKISQGPIANLTKRQQKPNQKLPSKNIGTKKRVDKSNFSPRFWTNGQEK
ncbi:hypothetical protein Q4504_01610 [Mesomycoplasma ovipneumoniae]|nr:hypothetical protein [Mesomycoplasma ovipneumoniae]MDO6857155.1 hypothetical protein [Mesomycoplasma ovipneumoniae]